MRLLRVTTMLAFTVLMTACGTGPGPSGTATPVPSGDPRIQDLVPAAIRQDGMLTIGTDPSYPPLEFLSSDGQDVQGADIDLATGIATVLRLEPDFGVDAFTALPSAVRSGRFELAIAGLTIRGRERRRADAVLYYRTGTQLIRSSDLPRLTWARMCGFRVAAVEGSVQIRDLTARSKQCRKHGRDPIGIQAYSEQKDGTTAVLAGTADGFLTDSPVAQSAVRDHPEELEAAGPVVDPAPLGMLTAPEFRAFTRAVRLALQQLIDSGYYQQVLAKWGIPDGAVSRAKVVWARHVAPPARKRER